MTLNAHQRFVVMQLKAHMWACRNHGVSFAQCMEEARRQFNQEVANAALTKPLPAK